MLKEVYLHHSVYHIINSVDNVTGVHTNTIEGTWAKAKTNVAIKHHNERDTSYFLELLAFKRNNQPDVV